MPRVQLLLDEVQALLSKFRSHIIAILLKSHEKFEIFCRLVIDYRLVTFMQ